MEQWQVVLAGMDVPMLLWLSRARFDARVMAKGRWWFALYAFLLIVGTLYLLWFLSAWCEPTVDYLCING